MSEPLIMPPTPYLAKLKGVRATGLKTILLYFGTAVIDGENVRVEVRDHQLKDFEAFCKKHGVEYIPAPVPHIGDQRSFTD